MMILALKKWKTLLAARLLAKALGAQVMFRLLLLLLLETTGMLAKTWMRLVVHGEQV